MPYIDPAYRDRYAEFARELKARRAAQRKAMQEGKSLFTDEGSVGFDEETGDDRDGEWNSTVRTRVLEGEGVVAEVLFPNGGVPFGGFGESAEHELRARPCVSCASAKNSSLPSTTCCAARSRRA